MRIIAISNQKGGSGKTTTAVNLAEALVAKKRRVLLLDLDPQCSASAWCGHAQGERGLLEVLEGEGSLIDHVTPTTLPKLDLIPSSPWLVGAEKNMAAEVGGEMALREQILDLPHQWDYLLMDCPPAMGILAINALTAAGELLVPVEAHIMALAGLAQLLSTVSTIQKRLNPDLRICGILACRVDRRTNHALEVVDQLRTRFGTQVFKTVIRENIRLAEAPSFEKPIARYAANSTGAIDYMALAKEVLAQEKRRK